MKPATYNLTIPQGTDWELPIRLNQTVVLMAGAAKGATSLEVQPFGVLIPAGTRWLFRFKGVGFEALLAADLAAGGAIATVERLTEGISRGATAQGPPMDLTGYEGRGQIRASYDADAVLANFVVTVVDEAEGRLAIALSRFQTGSLLATVAEKKTLKPYVYDVELESPQGKVSRVLQGEVMVTPEVTR